MNRPPLPPEHGSWALLACAFGLGLAIAPARPWDAVALAAGLLLSVHLLRAAVGAALGRRPRPGAWLWAAGWTASGLLCLADLVFGCRAYGLLVPVSIGAVGMALHIGLATVRRLDRSVPGELVATSLVALAAPATYAALGGHDVRVGVAAWAALSASGASGVVYVRMLLAPARAARDAFASLKPRLGSRALTCHFALALAAIGWLAASPGPTSAGMTLAVIPLVGRAVVGYRRLSPKLPCFVRVGVWETVWAVWFTVFAAVALRAGA